MATKKEESELSSISLTNINIQHNADTQLNPSGDFTNVPLQGNKPKRLVLKDPKDPDFENKKGKTPKRTVYFSDGILEEYSETEDEDEVDNTPKINPKSLKWLPWFWYYAHTLGSKSLNVADICGEKIAWFLGITSPKYQYAIDEYYRLQKEEEEEKVREERELELHRERRMKGDNPDIEAMESVPEVAFTNKAFLVNDEKSLQSNNNDETELSNLSQTARKDNNTEVVSSNDGEQKF